MGQKTTPDVPNLWLALVEFADEFGLTIQLAYYPPYHSKYNPIERVWVSWNSIGTVICSILAKRCSVLPQR